MALYKVACSPCGGSKTTPLRKILSTFPQNLADIEHIDES